MVFVVLHYLTTDDTVECVSSIRRCCADGEYQIIIVDNASPNKSGKQLMEKYEKDKDIDLLILEIILDLQEEIMLELHMHEINMTRNI